MSKRPTATDRGIGTAASSASNGAAPVAVDRAATFFDHADDANDVVQFYEWTPAGRWQYIERFDVAEVRALGLEEFILQHYGGGKYKAGLRNRAQSNVYGASVVVEIAGAPKLRSERDAARGTAPASTPIPPAMSSSAIPPWVEKIVLPIGVTFATAFGTLLAKKLLEEKPEKPTDPVILEAFKQLGRSREGTGATIDPIAMMNQLLELRERIVDSAPESSAPTSPGVAGAIERAVPQLVGVLNRKMDIDEQRMRHRRIPAAPAVTSTHPDGGAEIPAGDEQPPVTNDPLVALLIQVPMIARRFLLGAAESNESPELYADLVLSKLDDDQYAAMPALLGRADFVDVFVGTYPAFAEHRDWVTELTDAMRASIAPGDAENSGKGNLGAHGEGAPSSSANAGA